MLCFAAVPQGLQLPRVPAPLGVRKGLPGGVSLQPKLRAEDGGAGEEAWPGEAGRVGAAQGGQGHSSAVVNALPGSRNVLAPAQGWQR